MFFWWFFSDRLWCWFVCAIIVHFIICINKKLLHYIVHTLIDKSHSFRDCYSFSFNTHYTRLSTHTQRSRTPIVDTWYVQRYYGRRIIDVSFLALYYCSRILCIKNLGARIIHLIAISYHIFHADLSWCTINYVWWIGQFSYALHNQDGWISLSKLAVYWR